MDTVKILLVNPDSRVCMALTEAFSPDYSVYSAENFDIAFERFKEHEFYTVITGGDGHAGLDVVTKLQYAREGAPVLMMSTHSAIPAVVEAVKKGARDFTARPLNPDELKLVAQHALGSGKAPEDAGGKQVFQELSLIDTLTQLYNRRYFDELLQREEWRAKRYPQKFSLIMVDLDEFKKFNAYYGTPGGDKVLAKIGVMLLGRVRNTDVAARYEGAKFAVITPHTDKQHALILASRLCEGIAREEFLIDGMKAKVTVSIGLATFNDDACGKQALIKNAELALFQAKKLGKNRVCLFGVAA